MEEQTFIIALLVIAILAIASFTAGGSATGPLATPPDPNAEFGVLKEKKTFIGRVTAKPAKNVLKNEEPSLAETLEGAIKINRKNARSRDVDKEYIQIEYSPRKSAAPGKLNISGWTLSNRRGATIKIPGAARLPGLTAVPAETPIEVPKGGKVNIVTGRSPLGFNFRANKCIAYFKQFNSFTPSLPYSCPRPKDEPNQDGLSDKCFSYVKTLYSCNIPMQLPLYLDNGCRSYIAENVSYYGCIKNHRNDADFFNNEWWVYLKRPRQLWSDIRETITLSDGSGIVFAALNYN